MHKNQLETGHSLSHYDPQSLCSVWPQPPGSDISYDTLGRSTSHGIYWNRQRIPYVGTHVHVPRLTGSRI